MMIDYLNNLDHNITLFINSLYSPITDRFWLFMSDRYIWIILYALIIFMMFKRLGWKKALIVILAVVLSVVICDQLSNFVKNLVQRLRPCYDESMIEKGLHIIEDKGGLYGFFSGHAVNSFALAVCSWIGFKNDRRNNYKYYGMFMMIWAFLVSISRVFVAKHFFGDILVGAIIGIAIGYCAGWLAGLAIKDISK